MGALSGGGGTPRKRGAGGPTRHACGCSQGSTLPARSCGAAVASAPPERMRWRMQVRYLVMTEEAYRAKFAPAFLSDAQAAVYKALCATLTEPYKNVVRFDGAQFE